MTPNREPIRPCCAGREEEPAVLAAAPRDAGRWAPQELANARLAPEYRQTVKSVVEAMVAAGWDVPERVGETYHPVCCGAEVTYTNHLFHTFEAHCDTCGARIYDVTAPEFGNGWVRHIETERLDLSDPRSWVVIQTANPNPQSNGETV